MAAETTHYCPECLRLTAEVERLRAGIAWAQGMCSDAEPHEAISAFLSGVLTQSKQQGSGTDA